MTTTNKITKRDNYATLQAILKAAEEQGFGLPDGITYDSLNEFVAHEVELLDNKAAAAAKRAAEKKTAGDALREKVLSVLTDELQTIPAIVAAIGDVNVSAQMITPRLKQLVDLQLAEKDQISISGADGGKSRKAVAYRKA